MKRSKKRVVAKQYFSSNERFAELCNYGLFSGKKILQAENLSELDSEEQLAMGLFWEDTDVLWKNRDILKIHTNGTVFMIVGVENQTNVHYCMPLRNLVYDTLNYEKQRLEIYQEHRRKMDLQGDEYVSGFVKNDRLHPVFTLVLYYGKEEWDGARTLMELVDIPEELVQFKDKMLDYKINLLDVRRLEDTNGFSDELRALFGFMKYEKEKQTLLDYIEKNKVIFSNISVETARTISVLADVKQMEQYVDRQTKNGKERINMCQAIKEMENEARKLGRAEGERRGERRGARRGERRGKAIERERGIRILVEDNLEEGIGKEKILAKLIRRYHLDEVSAENYYARFAV